MLALQEKIKLLARSKGMKIFAHIYQPAEIQDLARNIGVKEHRGQTRMALS